MIDWTDKNEPVSKYFTVKDAIYLPRFDRLADKDELSEEAQEALTFLFIRMDQVFEFLGAGLHIHCAFRTPRYNEIVGGAKGSAHMARIGRELNYPIRIAAVDFSANLNQGNTAKDCDEIRLRLQPKLVEWDMRMENNVGGTWVHLDTKPVAFGKGRVFNP